VTIVQTESDLLRVESSPLFDAPTVFSPKAAPPSIELAEPLGYRLKNKLLGPPLNTEELAHERLGIPTALAVFSSDCISSSAYATEEILRQLIPMVGLAAFSLVLPITMMIIVVLFFLILSYRETIKEYPTAGGAYMVTRDNFGLLPAQVAGVSLLTDYILTVSVSTAAGTAALTSAVGGLRPYSLPIAIFFVLLIATVNLRGVKESGKAFSAPTYFFMAIMALLLIVGTVKILGGDLHPRSITGIEGAIPVKTGDITGGLWYGATLFLLMKAFASGGAAVTGVEAISNGVTAFKKPEWKNARVALVIMGGVLGTLFFGLSALAVKVHPIPYIEGSPTVISQIGDAVFGRSGVGRVLFYLLQGGTMLILVLAANTSFADFPRLASFHAGDNFMPRQLTKRGHRLVFSNGVISLSIASIVLLLVTDAKVDRLIPLYAIGVFTSFTMSQAGMAKHHVTRKEAGWRKGLVINGIGAVLSLIVDIIILSTKFMHGAWVIVLLVPIMVALLMRLNRQYEHEAVELAADAPRAAEAPLLRRHVVLVLVDALDVAAARAIQYARTLAPDELRAVHFDLDPIRTDDLTVLWRDLGFTRLSLDIVECADRRLDRAAAEVVAQELGDLDTEVTVLLPRREYTRLWHRLLHDRTADAISKALSTLPHCNVTIVPYHLADSRHGGARLVRPSTPTPVPHGNGTSPGVVDGSVAISTATHRQRVTVTGRVKSLRVQPRAGVATLECTVVDASGPMTVVFLGRRDYPGLHTGGRVTVEGVVGEHHGRLAMLNPRMELLADPNVEKPPTSH
jgi:amino acid transporter